MIFGKMLQKSCFVWCYEAAAESDGPMHDVRSTFSQYVQVYRWLQCTNTVLMLVMLSMLSILLVSKIFTMRKYVNYTFLSANINFTMICYISSML